MGFHGIIWVGYVVTLLRQKLGFLRQGHFFGPLQDCLPNGGHCAAWHRLGIALPRWSSDFLVTVGLNAI